MEMETGSKEEGPKSGDNDGNRTGMNTQEQKRESSRIWKL